MTPKTFRKIGNETFFYYDSEELAEFFKRGFLHGDVGDILYKRDEKSHTWLRFGTVENPVKDLQHVTLMDNPLYDGFKRMSDEVICTPTKSFFRPFIR